MVFDENMLTGADGIKRAYAQGVPMGGTLPIKSTADEGRVGSPPSPSFIVIASADPESAPLQRLQIVKGWIDADGTHEEVIDVACAGGANVDPETNRCPDNGATVDIRDCSIDSGTGSGYLSTLWRDPEFDPEQRSFYYARVIENPTCRWSTWDAIRTGVSRVRTFPVQSKNGHGHRRFMSYQIAFRLGDHKPPRRAQY